MKFEVVVALVAVVGTLIGILVQVVSVGIYIGKLSEHKLFIDFRLQKLEEKQDKHNNLIERTVKVEASTASAHKRLDEICKT